MNKIFLTLLLFAIAGCRHAGNRPSDPNMPAISMLLVDSSTRIHATDIPGGEPVVFIYFQPDCIHCQQETNSILRDIDLLRNIRLYMLTPQYRPLLKEFYNHYKLQDYDNIKVGVDEGMVFYKHFQATHIPYLAVFNKDKKLVTVHTGTFTINGLLNIIGE